jgi:hypothetical protein
VRLRCFVSAVTGQPLSALPQSLPDPVELLGDGAQPFALMVLASLGGVASRIGPVQRAPIGLLIRAVWAATEASVFSLVAITADTDARRRPQTYVA